MFFVSNLLKIQQICNLTLKHKAAEDIYSVGIWIHKNCSSNIVGLWSLVREIKVLFPLLLTKDGDSSTNNLQLNPIQGVNLVQMLHWEVLCSVLVVPIRELQRLSSVIIWRLNSHFSYLHSRHKHEKMKNRGYLFNSDFEGKKMLFFWMYELPWNDRPLSLFVFSQSCIH